MRKRIRLAEENYNRDHAFYLTACTEERKEWFRDHPGLAKECENKLITLAGQRSSDLFAWCVMPDHVHVLIRDRNPIEYIRLVKGYLASLARKIQASRGLWQRSFFDRALRSEESTQEVARYIWANPVRARLVNNPDEYAWSGSLVWPDWREEYGRG
jgi:REP element-mobilizing transposase RayT